MEPERYSECGEAGENKRSETELVRQSFVLDPDAQAYTDDEIVGKVNAAAVAITRTAAIAGTALSAVDSDDVAEGASNKYDTGVPPADLEALPDGTTRKAMSDTEKTKLGGVAEGATVDQSGAEIKTAYEGEANAYTDTKDTKLTGIAAGAEVNVGEEFTSGEQTKLSGIAAGAQPDQTGAEVRDLIVGLSDTERKFVMTEPAVGEFPIVTIERKADGKTNVQYDDVPIE